jgi:hypothetical protein
MLNFMKITYRTLYNKWYENCNEEVLFALTSEKCFYTQLRKHYEVHIFSKIRLSKSRLLQDLLTQVLFKSHTKLPQEETPEEFT